MVSEGTKVAQSFDRCIRATGEEMNFTMRGALDGSRQSAGLALSVLAYGAVFGMLARQAGLSLIEAGLMSGLVAAGTSQFMVLELWQSPLPVLAIMLTTLAVNLRFILMSASLHPWFSRLPARQAYASAFFIGDESWAMSMREFGEGKRDGAFLIGSGMTLFLAWWSATCAGYLLGAFLHDPARFGLDFAFTAAFVALLAGTWRGKQDLLPWAVAAATSIAAAQWLPGKWYILLGGIMGSVVGAIRDED